MRTTLSCGMNKCPVRRKKAGQGMYPSQTINQENQVKNVKFFPKSIDKTINIVTL